MNERIFHSPIQDGGSSQQNEHHGEIISPEFKFLANQIVTLLEENKSGLENGSIKRYGDFIEETSSGKKLLIKTISINEIVKSEDRYDNTDEYITILGLDPTDGKILGARLQSIHSHDPAAPITSAGMIVVREQGKGVASAMDTVLQKINQSIANEHGKKLIWNALNNNSNHLRALNAMVARTEDEYNRLKKFREEKTEEQKRWKALYGKGGKFGMDVYQDIDGNELIYEKTFSPSGETPQPMQKMDPVEYNQLTEQLRALMAK